MRSRFPSLVSQALLLVALLVAPATAGAASWGSISAPTPAQSVQLTWTDVEGTRTYDVSEGACGAEVLIATVTALTFTTSPADGTLCYVVVPTTGIDLDQSNEISVEVDATPPGAATFVQAPAASSNVRGSVAIQSSSGSDTGSGVNRVEFRVGSTVVLPDVRSAGVWDTTLTTDGVYTIRVVVIDNAGNETATSRANVRVDNTAPAVPTFVSGPASGSDNRLTLSFVGSSSDGGAGVVSVALQGDSGGGFLTRVSDASAPFDLDWATVIADDGLYTIRLLATDAAGNTSLSVVNRTSVRVDNTAPPAAAFLQGPAASTTVRGPVSVQSSTPIDGGSGLARVEFRVGATTVLNDVRSVGTWDTTAAPDAIVTISVVAIDAAGNETPTARTSIQTDNTPPGPVAQPTASVSPTRGAPVILWPASGGDVVGYDVFRDGAIASLNGAPLAATTYTDTALPLDGIADGPHTYAVTGFDSYNHGPVSPTVTVVVDTTPPVAPPALTAAPRTTARAVDVTWTAPADGVASSGDHGSGVVSYVVRRANGAVAPATATTGVAICTVPAPTLTCVDATVAEKTAYAYAVFAVDAAGNTGPAASATATASDITGPAGVRNLRADVVGAAVGLIWANPTDADFARVEVVVNAKRAPQSRTDGTRIASGRIARYQAKQKAGTRAYYAVFALDGAGNVSVPVGLRVTTPKPGPLYPPAGSELRRGAALSWDRTAKATYYNIQVYLGKKLITQAWPVTNAFRLAGKLKKGSAYTWYVWPGFGARSAVKYGKLIGQSRFRYRG